MHGATIRPRLQRLSIIDRALAGPSALTRARRSTSRSCRLGPLYSGPSAPRWHKVRRVHPRTRGHDRGGGRSGTRYCGPSAHVRGTRSASRRATSTRTVHPRTRGGDERLKCRPSSSSHGPSAHARAGQASDPNEHCRLCVSTGRSIRARADTMRRRQCHPRPIQTRPATCDMGALVHPRSRGFVCLARVKCMGWVHPRLRGHEESLGLLASPRRFIRARAGKLRSRQPNCERREFAVHPRARGRNEWNLATDMAHVGPSALARERRTTALFVPGAQRSAGSSAQHAGTTSSPDNLHRRASVHPRTRGPAREQNHSVR